MKITRNNEKKAKDYKKKWNEKNKEKIKAYNEQYWKRKAQEMKDL